MLRQLFLFLCVLSHILGTKDGQLRSVGSDSTPDQHLDSDSNSNSSWQKIYDSDFGPDSSCQKIDDSDSDSESESPIFAWNSEGHKKLHRLILLSFLQNSHMLHPFGYQTCYFLAITWSGNIVTFQSKPFHLPKNPLRFLVHLQFAN